jgi:hypothetical protein
MGLSGFVEALEATHLLGEPGENRFVGPGVMCRSAGWFDDDEE